MQYKLEEILDIPLLKELQEKLNLVYSVPSSIIDKKGNIIISAGWPEVCIKFHRSSPESRKECIEADNEVSNLLSSDNPVLNYKCPHGLTKNILPIIIRGEHYGNFVTGHYFTEKPDMENYSLIADKYKYDKEKYRESLNKVPVWDDEKLLPHLSFVKGFVEIIKSIAQKNIEKIESNSHLEKLNKDLTASIENNIKKQEEAEKAVKELEYSRKKLLKEKEEKRKTEISLNDTTTRLSIIFEKSPLGLVMTRISDGMILDANEAMASIYGYEKEEILGRTSFELKLWADNEARNDLVNKVKECGFARNIEISGIKKNGEIVDINLSIEIFEQNGELYTISIMEDISDRKRIEAAFEESENKYRALFQNNHTVMLILDRDTEKIVDANPAAAKFYGWSVQELCNMNIGQINTLPAEERRKKFESSVSGTRNHFYFKHRISNGSLKDVEAFSGVIEVNSKKMLYVIIHDVTERLKSENELKFHKRILEETGKIAKVGGWSFDAVTGEGYWTDEVAYIHDLDPQNATSREIGLSFYTIESRPIIESAINNSITNGIPYDLELEIISAKGVRKWVRTIGHPEIENGKVVRVFGSFQDITSQKKIELELRESRAKLDAAMESMTDALFISDLDGNFIHFNEAFATVHRFKNKGECAKTLNEYPDFLEVYMDNGELAPFEKWAVPRALNGETVKNAIYTLIRKDTGESWVGSYSFSPIRDKDGNTVGAVAVGRDITDQKYAEMELEKHRNHLEELVESRTEELDALNRELISQIMLKQEAEVMLKNSLEREKELNTLKSRFISTASHEFKTPLTSVLSSVELIQRYGKNFPDEKKEVHLERIKNAVMYLTNLINDVLDVSRADAGRLEFNPQPVDLLDLCGRVVEEAKVYGKENHNIILDYNCSKQMYKLDSKQMFTILQNLVSNAVKYSPSGGDVILQLKDSDGTIKISVSDKGIGIPEKEISALFEPFHRSNNVGEIRGTGLGLTIMKNAVDLHKGKIHVNSALGKGTTFFVDIPLIN